MKPSKIRALPVIALLCAVVLTACTDSSISEVKKSSMPQSDFTFGEALDNAKGCQSTEWTHREDGNGRPVVEYTCTAEMSSRLVEIARKENTDQIRMLTKRLEDTWEAAADATRQGQKTWVQAGAQAKANNEAKLKQLDAQIQGVQQRLERLTAMTPQDFIGHGPSGYTPALIEQGGQRRQIAIEQEQRQMEHLKKQHEATTAAQSDPSDTSRQFGLDQYRSADEYQRTLDGIFGWKERYDTAIREAEAREMKKAEDFLTTAKDRKLQMKITFLVKNKSPVKLSSAKWFYDGKDDGGVNVTYLAVVLLDPKRMQEVIDSAMKSRLKMEINSSRYQEAFPIVCSEKIVDGCELRKSSS